MPTNQHLQPGPVIASLFHPERRPGRGAADVEVNIMLGLLICALFGGCASSKPPQTSSSAVAPAARRSTAPLAYQWYFNATNQDDPRNWYDILDDDDRTGF
jgi:hypothetical protein